MNVCERRCASAPRADLIARQSVRKLAQSLVRFWVALEYRVGHAHQVDPGARIQIATLLSGCLLGREIDVLREVRVPENHQFEASVEPRACRLEVLLSLMLDVERQLVRVDERLERRVQCFELYGL